jgi:hypothetical protein
MRNMGEDARGPRGGARQVASKVPREYLGWTPGRVDINRFLNGTCMLLLSHLTGCWDGANAVPSI